MADILKIIYLPCHNHVNSLCLLENNFGCILNMNHELCNIACISAEMMCIYQTRNWMLLICVLSSGFSSQEDQTWILLLFCINVYLNFGIKSRNIRKKKKKQSRKKLLSVTFGFINVLYKMVCEWGFTSNYNGESVLYLLVSNRTYSRSPRYSPQSKTATLFCCK